MTMLLVYRLLSLRSLTSLATKKEENRDEVSRKGEEPQTGSCPLPEFFFEGAAAAQLRYDPSCDDSSLPLCLRQPLLLELRLDMLFVDVVVLECFSTPLAKFAM